MTRMYMWASQWPKDTSPTVGNLSTTVTFLAEQEMLTPQSETNLSQQRRSQSLAGKYLLGAQRYFSHNFHRFWAKHYNGSKHRESITLLIVRRSYDSKEWEKNNKRILHLQFVFDFHCCSQFLRMTILKQKLCFSSKFLRGRFLHINLLDYMINKNSSFSSAALIHFGEVPRT